MSSKIWCLFLCLVTLTVKGQPHERLTGYSSRPQEASSIKHYKKTASLDLPVIDDFSYRSHIPESTIWEDQNVYINQTFGISPPSIGVATFDGLDENGHAYELGKFGVDTADILTSQPIDLRNPGDSVYLSFFWQAAGLGEFPETGDSLTLYFYTPQSAEWARIWSISGIDSITDFTQEMIPVPDAYHKDNFQFRLISYGAQAGAFDMWQLDYVRLDDGRSFADTLFDDVAFTRPHPSLLSEYAAIPWFHYTSNAANKANSNFYYRKNNDGASQNINLCLYEIMLGSNVLASEYQGQPDPNSPALNVENVYNCLFDPFFPGAQSGEFVLTAYQTHEGSNEDPLTETNDTIWHEQHFKNYYAYDDGSAEQAYLVDDNGGGFMLQKYEIAQADDLRGLYLYFLPSEYDIEQNEFTIVVYENNNGVPGSLIYESDTTHTPHYTTSNFYLAYPIAQDTSVSVQVGTSFFAGIKQVKNTPLPIGYDANTLNFPPIIFYGKPNDYYQSSLRGKLMIRPYFRYTPKDFSISYPIATALDIQVYPNPASSHVFVKNNEENSQLQYSLYNLSGQLVDNGEVSNSAIRLQAHLNDGVYVLRIVDSNGKKAPYTQKLILRK